MTRAAKKSKAALRVLEGEIIGAEALTDDVPAHRRIEPFLAQGVLPEDIRSKLRAAETIGVAKLQDVAEQLNALRGLNLPRPVALGSIANAANRAVQRWVQFRGKGLQPVDPDSGIEKMHPARFCDGFVVTFAWEAQSHLQRLMNQGLLPEYADAGAMALIGADLTQQRNQRQAALRVQTVASWERQPTFAVRGTIFAQRHAAELARAFPDLPLDSIERAMGAASAPIKSGDFMRSPTLDVALRKASRQLALEAYGPPEAQIGGAPVAKIDGNPLANGFVALGQPFVDDLIAAHPILAAKARGDFHAMLRTVLSAVVKAGSGASPQEALAGVAVVGGVRVASANWANDIDLTAIDLTGLSPEHYGRGLQQQVEAIVTKLAELIAAKHTKENAP